jgi:hypothetical protein
MKRAATSPCTIGSRDLQSAPRAIRREHSARRICVGVCWHIICPRRLRPPQPRATSSRRNIMKSSSHKKSSSRGRSKVGRAMHEMKRGQLRSGRSGKKVKSRKQAIAIGLSEARRSGARIPRKGKSSRARGRSRSRSRRSS